MMIQMMVSLFHFKLIIFGLLQLKIIWSSHGDDIYHDSLINGENNQLSKW